MSPEGKKEEGAMRIMEALSGVDEALLERCGADVHIRGEGAVRSLNRESADYKAWGQGGEGGKITAGRRRNQIPWRSLGACAAALCLMITGVGGWLGYQARKGPAGVDGYSGGSLMERDFAVPNDSNGEGLSGGEAAGLAASGAGGENGASNGGSDGEESGMGEVQKDGGGVEKLNNSCSEAAEDTTDGATHEKSAEEEVRQEVSHEEDKRKGTEVEYAEEEARKLERLGEYIPTVLPKGYVFESAYVNQELAEENLTVCWSRGMDLIVIHLTDGGETTAVVDIDRPETYDERLYDIPFGETVPQEYRQSVQNPVFAVEDFSMEIVESRMLVYEDNGDADTPRGNFSVLYPDGVVAAFNGRGTAQEIWDMFSSMNSRDDGVH